MNWLVIQVDLVFVTIIPRELILPRNLLIKEISMSMIRKGTFLTRKSKYKIKQDKAYYIKSGNKYNRFGLTHVNLSPLTKMYKFKDHSTMHRFDGRGLGAFYFEEEILIKYKKEQYQKRFKSHVK